MLLNNIKHTLAELTNVLDTSDKVTAHGGSLTVTITNGQPKVYTTKRKLACVIGLIKLI